MTNLTLVVVTSLLSAQSPDWSAAADALAAKHADEAKVVRLTATSSVTNLTDGLRAVRPTHVAFVMRPEEIDFPTVVGMKRMMRALDDDPFDDAKWGIVTGPTAADARRIASSREPRRIRSLLATTGVDDGVIPGPLACLSDAYPAGEWRLKASDGSVAKHSSSNDISHVFAKAWDDLDPNLILTSSHASQRNLEMPFSRGNIVPRNGVFQTQPNEELIDYRTGQAKESRGASGEKAVVLSAPTKEKVWLAAGNCLIADNLRPGENMVMTALGFGKVNQFVGYISTTWFGEIGWTTWANFREGMSLVDAYYAANDKLLHELEETVENASAFQPTFASAKDYERLFKEARAFKFKAPKRIEDPQKFIGRLWDRDATVFYGDPLVQVYLNPKE